MKKFCLNTSKTLIMLALTLGFGTLEVNAAENNEIYPETQKIIDEAILLDEGNEVYVESIISLFENDIQGTSDELNELVSSALLEANETTKKVNQETEVLYQEALNKQEMNKNYIKDISRNATTMSINPIDTALNLYKAGISVVKSMGHNQTASYMEHAIIDLAQYGNSSWRPSTYISTNNAWAKKAATEDRFNAKVYNQFYNEIIATGKTNGNVDGSYDYPDGELHTAINKFKYNITFTKQSNGGYKAVYKITDIYDFDWDSNGYNNFKVGFANNYCALVQNMGLIVPYTININYTM